MLSSTRPPRRTLSQSHDTPPDETRKHTRRGGSGGGGGGGRGGGGGGGNAQHAPPGGGGDDPAVHRTFEDMGLKEDLLRGLYAYGYERPSAVQQRAIVPILRGRDACVQAQSGTGKSSLIALCVCQMVDARQRELSCVQSCLLLPVLSPPPAHWCLNTRANRSRAPLRQNKKQKNKHKKTQRPGRRRLAHPRARPPDRAPHPRPGRLPQRPGARVRRRARHRRGFEGFGKRRGSGGLGDARAPEGRAREGRPARAVGALPGDRRGGRDALGRVQGAGVPRVPLPAGRGAGRPSQRHLAGRGPPDDGAVYDRPGEGACAAGRADARGEKRQTDRHSGRRTRQHTRGHRRSAHASARSIPNKTDGTAAKQKIQKQKQKNIDQQGIKQFFVAVEKEEWKFDTLCDLYDTLTVTQAVIFVNSRKKVEWLSAKMKERQFAVSSMHGEMPQKDRDGVMNEFRTGASRVLITTDS